jgi:non-specific serine/threonine protein kinase
MEWSHALLRPSEKAMLQRLAAFNGGFTLEAAEAVCRLDGHEDVLADLESLVEKNLVNRGVPGGEPRYTMLVTVREFAEDRLRESGEEARARRRHAEYYCQLVERAEPELDRAAGGDWARRLEQEYGNISAAMGWSLEHAVETALRISGAVQRFCTTQGHWRDDKEWIERSVAKSGGLQGGAIDRLRAKAFTSLSNVALGPLREAECLAAGSESVAIWRRLGDKQGLGHALLRLGLASAYAADEPGPVLALLEESAALQRAIGDIMGLAHTVFYLSYFTYVAGDHGRARALAKEDSVIAQTAGDVVRFAACDALLGLYDVEDGDYARALARFEKSLDLYGPTEDHVGLGIAHFGLGVTSLLQGDSRRARSLFETAPVKHSWSLWEVAAKICVAFISVRENKLEDAQASFREALVSLRPFDSRWARYCIGACCAGLAGVKALRGQVKEAAHIVGGVESTMRRPYARLAWGWDFTVTPTFFRIELDSIAAQVMEMLGESGAAELEAGRASSLDETIERALS